VGHLEGNKKLLNKRKERHKFPRVLLRRRSKTFPLKMISSFYIFKSTALVCRQPLVTRLE